MSVSHTFFSPMLLFSTCAYIFLLNSFPLLFWYICIYIIKLHTCPTSCDIVPRLGFIYRLSLSGKFWSFFVECHWSISYFFNVKKLKIDIWVYSNPFCASSKNFCLLSKLFLFFVLLFNVITKNQHEHCDGLFFWYGLTSTALVLHTAIN